MKKVSVIIPTYNCAKYVRGAVESVLKQSYGNVEIVVIDDGSKDNTKEILAPYFGKIIYIYQENKGLPGARNRGIHESSGDFIAFLDADDLWESRKLEIQMAIMDSHPEVCIVFSDFYVFSDDGYRENSYFKKCFPIFREYDFSLDTIFRDRTNIDLKNNGNVDIYHGNIAKFLFCGNFILPSSALVRKSVAERIGGFDETYRMAEETDYFLRLCSEGNAAYVDMPLAGYLIKRAGNLTGSPNTERLIRNAISIQEKYIRQNPGFRMADRAFVDRAMAGSHRRLAYFFLSETRNADARVEAGRSISMNPAQFAGYFYYLLSFLPKNMMSMLKDAKRRLK